jgi:hypothetical protein
MVAALLVGTMVRRLAGDHVGKSKKILERYVDQPPVEQGVLERMVAHRFSTTPRDRWPGRLESVPIGTIMPDYLYLRWLSLLHLFDQGALSVIMGYEDTDYYRHQVNVNGAVYAKKKVAKFWRTYRSIKSQGFQENEKELPLILLQCGSATVRVDGAHRSSVLRHFGFKSLPAYVLGIADLRSWPVESEEQRRAIEWFLGLDTSVGMEFVVEK